MEKTKYYYHRDYKNRPMVTVCLLQANGDITRGTAICSDMDNPCKKTGRKISRDRAVYAMKKKVDSCEINKNAYVSGGCIGGFKSEFNPLLTDHENTIIYGTPCPC